MNNAMDRKRRTRLIVFPNSPFVYAILSKQASKQVKLEKNHLNPLSFDENISYCVSYTTSLNSVADINFTVIYGTKPSTCTEKKIENGIYQLFGAVTYLECRPIYWLVM